jgi:hypothetical protein
MNNKWTRNQKILVIGLSVSVIALLVQVKSLENKIQINNIVKVEKEITKTEVFRKTDVGIKTAFYTLAPKTSVIVFLLQNIPERNSIKISDNYGFSYPPTTFIVKSNMIIFNVGELEQESFFKDAREVYVIQYSPDDNATVKKISTIKDLESNKLGNTSYPK